MIDKDKEAVEDEEGDSFAATQQAQRKYQEFVQRDLTTGEYDDIQALTNLYCKEFKEEKNEEMPKDIVS